MVMLDHPHTIKTEPQSQSQGFISLERTNPDLPETKPKGATSSRSSSATLAGDPISHSAPFPPGLMAAYDPPLSQTTCPIPPWLKASGLPPLSSTIAPFSPPFAATTPSPNPEILASVEFESPPPAKRRRARGQ